MDFVLKSARLICYSPFRLLLYVSSVFTTLNLHPPYPHLCSCEMSANSWSIFASALHSLWLSLRFCFRTAWLLKWWHYRFVSTFSECFSIKSNSILVSLCTIFIRSLPVSFLFKWLVKYMPSFNLVRYVHYAVSYFVFFSYVERLFSRRVSNPQRTFSNIDLETYLPFLSLLRRHRIDVQCLLRSSSVLLVAFKKITSQVILLLSLGALSSLGKYFQFKSTEYYLI